MVGVKGIEPLTFWSRTKRATRLRYTPTIKRGAYDTFFHQQCKAGSMRIREKAVRMTGFPCNFNAPCVITPVIAYDDACNRLGLRT